MFRCRMCTEPPFNHLFNLRIFNGYFNEETSKKNIYQISEGDSIYDTQSYGSSLIATPSNLNNFDPRSPEEINSICLKWEKCVHERGREFWKTSECLLEVLSAIARGINNNDDPILGDPQRCVPWYGQVSAIDGCPVIKMKRPDEAAETHTYVNRALVFLYASDESFQELQLKPRVAFNMACGNRRCVHLRHISLDD